MDFESVADELFAGPREEFTTVRDQRARQARPDRELAKRIAGRLSAALTPGASEDWLTAATVPVKKPAKAAPPKPKPAEPKPAKPKLDEARKAAKEAASERDQAERALAKAEQGLEKASAATA